VRGEIEAYEMSAVRGPLNRCLAVAAVDAALRVLETENVAVQPNPAM